MGIPVRELIDTHCGGVRGGWGNLLAIIHGGSSMPVIPAHQCDELKMDFDGCAALKSSLGTAAVIVMDKSTDINPGVLRASHISTSTRAAGSARRAARAWAGCGAC